MRCLTFADWLREWKEDIQGRSAFKMFACATMSLSPSARLTFNRAILIYCAPLRKYS